MLLPFVLQEQRKLEYPLFSGCVGRVLDILRDYEVAVRPVGIYNGRIIEFSLVVGCRVLIYRGLTDGIDYLLALIKFVYSGAGELAVPVAALIRTDDHPLSGILPLARTFSGLSVRLGIPDPPVEIDDYVIRSRLLVVARKARIPLFGEGHVRRYKLVPVREPEHLRAAAGADSLRFVGIEDSLPVLYLYLFDSVLNRYGIVVIAPDVGKRAVPVVRRGYLCRGDKLAVSVELNGNALRTDAVVIVLVVPFLIHLY